MNTQEKIKEIKNLCEELGVTAYEIGNNTTVSTFAVTKILNGTTKNPNKSTLQVIRNYLHGQLDPETGAEKPLGMAQRIVEQKKSAIINIEDMIAEKVLLKLEPYIVNHEISMAATILDLEEIKLQLKRLEQKINQHF